MTRVSLRLRLPWLGVLLLCGALLPSWAAAAAPGIPALTVSGSGSGQSYSLTLQLLVLMTAITLLPSILLMMTAFTRIIIDQINTQAVQPYMAGTIETTEALSRGAVPLRQFMLDQTRESDISTFVRIAGGKGYARPEDVPMSILVPAFATGELTESFKIGFLLFLPFIVIDLIISNILLAMGMMMVSPMTISLPFKLLLFVSIDGWERLIQGLVLTYSGGG